MKQVALLFLVLLYPISSFCQGYENTIIFGYAGGSISPNDDEFGLNVLTFSDGSLQISDNQASELFFNDTDAAISGKNGKLLFYFNGIDIYDATHKPMLNGSLLNPYNATGYDLPQGGIIIPYPGKSGKYILFHAQEGYIAPWGVANIGVYYSVVDMSLNNGLGRVTQRKIPLVVDTLEYGKLALTRHANGRDWWLIIGEAHHNAFYQVLIDPYGVNLVSKQFIGTDRLYGIGQSCFSPDGTKYVMFTSIGAGGYYQYLDIYSFDRCNGLFSKHEHFELTGNSGNGGAIISPNSRWLYAPSKDWLYKFDLLADTVASSKEIIATYEPFNDPFSTKFHRGFLAPDDKIYITTTSGSRTLHVIHKPDEPGTSCSFEQHGIRLPCNNNSSLPTFANYRLGPLDGSVCDTLGLNNNPVAWWRYEQDTGLLGRYEFRDLSYHEPTTWKWDFGDGKKSAERHPVHEYASTGSYNVCLTVSNVNGSSIHCKALHSTVSVASDPQVQAAIEVSPNPFRGRLAVAVSAVLHSPMFRLYDALGRLVREEHLAFGITEVETGYLPAGVYFWEVLAAPAHEAGTSRQRVKSGKAVKIE